MATVRSFHRYRGEASITLPRLIEILREQLPGIAPRQTRYRVTTVPTERTIRFYTANGLVDRPLGHAGQSALYGYRHLLQVLAVKYLQSHYLPLRKIRSLVESAGNRDLEQLMPEISPTSWAHRGFTRADRSVSPAVPSQPAGARPATAGTAEQSEAPTPAADEPAPLDADSWHRMEVSPGIELLVHAAALSAAQRERVRGVLLRELGALRGWFD